MALISNNISGSASNGSKIGITGSVIFANVSGPDFPSLPGSDVTFFVSGSTLEKSVFGGDVYISGSFATKGGLSGSLTKLLDGTSYLIASSPITINTGSNGAVTIGSTATSMVGGNGSNNNIITADGTGGLVAESNLNFDGSTLNITGSIIASNLNSNDKVLITSGSSRTISQATGLVWDSTNNYLGVDVLNPARNIHVLAGIRVGTTNYLEWIQSNSTTQRFIGGGSTSIIEFDNDVLLPTPRTLGFQSSAAQPKDVGFSRVGPGILSVSGSAPGVLFRFNASSTPLSIGDLGMNTTSGRPNALIGGNVRELAHVSEIAPVAASYVVMSGDATLTNERALGAGTGLILTDGGAGSTVTLGINNGVVATVSGTTFTGATRHIAGLSGSLTTLADGTPYLIAGSNIVLSTGSTGAITIASSAGGGVSFNGGIGSNNNVITADGSGAIVAESNLSFDGSSLNITGSIIASNLSSSDRVLITSGSSRTITQSNMIWDSTNSYLGLGVATPGRNLNVNSGVRFGQTNFVELIGANSTTWRWVNGGTITTLEHQPRLIFPANRGNLLAWNSSETIAPDIGFSRAASGILNFSGSAPGALFRFNATSTPLLAGDLGMSTTSGRPNALIGGATRELAHVSEIAPVTASYVVMSTDSTLSNERVLTAGTGLSLTDGGAGGNVTLAINDSVVATVTGSRFTGTLIGATDIVASGTFKSLNSSGDEGGEIFLSKPVTNTSIDTGVTIDIYQNRLRVFETGGSNRGGYYDVTSLIGSAGTNFATDTKTHSGYAGSQHTMYTFGFDTSATSFVTANTIRTLNENEAIWIDVFIIARQTAGGSNRSVYQRQALYYRNSGGSTTQQGSTNTPWTQESAASDDVQFNTSGNDIVIQVRNASANNYSWVGTVRYQVVATSA